MGVLIGSADTIRIPLHVKITDGDDVIDVKFIGIYKRTTPKIRKARAKRLFEAQGKHVKMIQKPTDDMSYEEKDKLIDETMELGEEIEALQVGGLVGWSDLKGHDDQTVEYSKKALAEMLASDPYRLEIADGQKRSNGVVDQKN